MTENQNHDQKPSVTEATPHWQQLVATAMRVTDADRGVLVRFSNGELTPMASAPPTVDRDVPGHVFEIPGIESVYLDNRSCIIPDVTDTRGAATMAQQSTLVHDRSLLAVPVQEIGILCVTASEPGAFTETDQSHVEWLVQTVLDATSQNSMADADDAGGSELSVASVFAHDIQNPLQLARGYLELAEQSDDPGHYETIRTALDRIETMANGLASLARAEEQIPNRVPVHLATAAREAWTTIEAPDATLNVEGECSVTVNEDTFQQLLENLYQNAVAHAGADVTVRVGCHQTGFYVEDDGPGIPAEDREQVFEWRYSSADRSGIGLSIVDRIAQLHGWDLEITEGQTGGARFEFHIEQPAKATTPARCDTT